MTDSGASPDANRRRNLVLAILGGLVLIAGGVALGMSLGGDETTSPSTTAPAGQTSVEPGTSTSGPGTSSTVATTTTSLATTTTVAPVLTELSFPVSEDTTVDSDNAGEVLGSEEALEVLRDGPDTLRSLVRFQVEGIPDGQTVVDAVLRFTVIDASHGGGVLSLVDGPWDEASTTWANAPAIGLAVTPLPIGMEGLEVDLDVTRAVTGNGTVDFYLSSESDDDYEIASRESGSGAVLLLTVAPDGSQLARDRGTVLVGAGDIAGCDSDGDEATAVVIDRVIADAEETVVYTTGDNAYNDGSTANFSQCYEPSWGRFKDFTRPAAGAREYRTSGAGPHFSYFGDAAGTPGEGWYSYDLAGWHIIVLNANCEEIGGCGLDSIQGAWLQEDLAANDVSCTLAYWHDPVFSSKEAGGNPDLGVFYDLLNEADVEVVINGDDHYYERFTPQDSSGEDLDEGLRQFTVGTGGHSLAEFGPPASNSVVRYNEGFGVLVIELLTGGYEWEYITVDGAIFNDRGTDECH